MNFFARRFVYRELWAIHNIRWLAISNFFAGMIFYSSVIVLFERDRGLNITEMFLLESLLSACIWLFNIPTGVWADSWGYRLLIIFGRSAEVVGLVLFAFAHTFWMFALGDALAGICIASIAGSESALVYTSLPEETAETLGTSAFALLNASTTTGFFFGLTFGSFMAAYGPAIPVFITLIPAVLASLATLQLRSVPCQVQKGAPQEQPSMLTILRTSLRSIWQWPVLVGFSFFDAAAFALLNAIFWYNQLYFARVGIPVVAYGLLIAAAQALALLTILLTPLAKRYLGIALALVLSCLLPGLAYIALFQMQSPIFTVLLVAIIVASPTWRQPIVNDELNKHISNDARATKLSALSFIGALTGMLLNLLIGRLGDIGLGVASVSIGSGLLLLCLLAVVLVALLGKMNH